MNFKKNQRRIPMNMKKIIPLTFTALSVAGALSACSDSAVVGADVQGNSVAETTTVIEPVIDADVQRVMVARLKEVAKPNAPTSAILAHDSTLQLTVIKTFDGDSIYNNEKNRMLNMNYLDTTITENKGWTYYSMQDENGVLHGPIAMAQFAMKALMGITHYVNDVACVNENKSLRVGDVVHKSSDSYEFSHITIVETSYSSPSQSQEKRIQSRSLQTRDSLMLAQFIEDCAALDGKIGREDASYMIGGVEAGVNPKLTCTLEKDDYYDPYWEKYASFIVNSCRSDIESIDHIPVVQCPEDKCSDPRVESDTMVEDSSSSVEAALRSASRGTAVTYSHIAGEADSQTDTVTAHETFDRVVQSILDFDPSIRYSEEAFSSYADDWTYVAMKDEEGFVHGEIMFEGGEHATVRNIDVSCFRIDNDDGDLYQVFFNSKSHPYHVPNTAVKYMLSMDSSIREEFRKDCALENGKLENGEDGDRQIVCLVKSEEVNGVETYKDPNWKKYAKHIIESCVSTQKIDE